MTHHSDLELPVWLMVAYICGDPPVSAPILLGLYMLKEPPTPNTAGGPFQTPQIRHKPHSVFTERSFIKQGRKAKVAAF